MRNAILLLCIVMTTGCNDVMTLATPSPEVRSADELTRYVDKENSVICYQVFYASSTAFSCVKVK